MKIETDVHSINVIELTSASDFEHAYWGWVESALEHTEGIVAANELPAIPKNRIVELTNRFEKYGLRMINEVTRLFSYPTLFHDRLTLEHKIFGSTPSPKVTSVVALAHAIRQSATRETAPAMEDWEVTMTTHNMYQQPETIRQLGVSLKVPSSSLGQEQPASA